MDPLLTRFHRQYLQQIQNLTYPPPKLLIHPDIQDQLYRRFFDGPQRPSPAYQRKVLKELIKRIESAITDPDEDAVSDKLMEHISYLSTITESDPATAASEPQLIIFTLPEPVSSLCLKNKPAAIHILETPRVLAAQSDTGLRTWEAALHLATYLHANPDLVHGKKVVELGAGTGFLSLLCAGPLLAKYVMATDGAPHVVDRMKGNFARNRGHLLDQDGKDHSSTLLAKVLDWGDTENSHDVLEIYGDTLKYDLILGADITYHPDVVPVLAELLRVLMVGSLGNSGIEALISATVRNEMTLNVFKDSCVKRGLSVETVDFCCPSEREQDGFFHEQAFPITIMRIKQLQL